MADSSALQNLHVIDLTDDTGRFATKLLAEAGADVLRVGRGSPGVAMKGQAGERGGLLDWWYDGGKQRLELDLDSPEGQRQFKDLTTRADLLIETEPPGRLARLGLDFPDLHALNPRLVHVSLTPFGRQGPRAHWQTSDLVAAALGGVLSVTGTPDAPLNGWGRQCFNTASFFAAICGLAGVYAARETGHGQHIDLSLHQSVISCTEQVLMFWFFHKMFPVAIAPRQASLHWTGAFKVAPCASGQVMVTPGAHMPVLVDWLDADGMAGDLKELDLTDTLKVFAHIPHIMELLQAWVATKDAHELFLAAQQRHLPFGEVLTVAEVAHNPHLQERSFFRTVDWSGPEVKMPGPLFRLLGTPAPSPLPPAMTSADVVVENFSVGVLDRWGVGYNAVHQWNERIIFLSMAGAGQDGPWRDFVTYAPTIHALCGLTYLTNPPERKDIGTGFALTDHLSGLAGALAVVEALAARRRMGGGQFIDLSQLEVGAYLVGPAFVDFLSNGHEAQPQGNQDAFADHVPNNVYRCLNDEWLAITTRDEQEWRRLCETIGAQELANDSRLTLLEGRLVHQSEVDEAIGKWAARQDAEQAMRQLQAVGVPAGKVQNARDLTERDEQLAAQQWLLEVDHTQLGRHQLDRFPATFGDASLEPYRVSEVEG